MPGFMPEPWSRGAAQPVAQRNLFPERRAESPRTPTPSPAVAKAQQEHAAYLQEREARERRSVLRGLVFLAIIVLLISLFRAGMDRAFFTGWWRQW